MTRPIKLLIALALLILTGLIVFLLLVSKPKADRRYKQHDSAVHVSIAQIQPQTYAPLIRSFGSVEPVTQSRLVAQVGGRIDYVADNFRDGGTFNAGDLLLQIEKADYEIELAVAQANLLDSERILEEEQARVQQAKADWQRLGNTGEPAPLVLRAPQLKAAHAALAAAQARVRAAELALARTEVRAPYRGRIVSKNADLGQVVAANSALAETFASDAAEIRLPIKNTDLRFITLPEQAPKQTLYADIVSDLIQPDVWRASLVRSSAAVDEASRQIYVVAQLQQPFIAREGEGRGQYALKAGQYVTASIEAHEIENALLVPNSAIYQGAYVYVYENKAVFRRELSFQWQDAEFSVVDEGLEAGEYVVTSPLGKVASGTRARALGSAHKASTQP